MKTNKLFTFTKLKYVFYIFCSFCFTLGISEYFFDDSLWGNESIFNCLLFLIGIFLLKETELYKDLRLRISCICFSFLLSLSLIVGRSFYFYLNFQGILSTPKNIVMSLLSLLGLTLIFHAFFILIIQHLPDKETTISYTQWKIFKYPFLLFIFIFLAWIPCYLSYYPGIFSYDIDVQSLQALGHTAITKYHPPLHTLIWQFCLKTEHHLGLNGLAVYSIMQMVLLSSAFTYVLHFLIRRKTNNWLILVALLYFSLNPVIALFSFIPTKDVMFTAFFILLTIDLCYFICDIDFYSKNIFFNLRFIIWGVLCCLFRNNMIYAFIPAIIIMILFVRKHRKTIITWGICIITFYIIINGPIYSALDVQEGNSREMLSVPMQQISYVVKYCEESLSSEDISDISKYLPINDLDEIYNLRLADPVKIYFNTENFNQDPSAFFKLWFRLLKRYPNEFIVAFINLNLPYWYPDACSIDAYATQIYINTSIYPESISGYEVIRESKLPQLYTFYEKIASYQMFKTTPVISNIFSISTPIWVLLFTILALICKKKYYLLLPLLPACFLWLTYLLGPVSNLRYMLPIFVLYPLYFILFLHPNIIKKTDCP